MKKQITEEWEKEFGNLLFVSCPKNHYAIYRLWRWKDWGLRVKRIREELKKEIDNLIAEEMLICHHENQPTSRLTSLVVKIKKLK